MALTPDQQAELNRLKEKGAAITAEEAKRMKELQTYADGVVKTLQSQVDTAERLVETLSQAKDFAKENNVVASNALSLKQALLDKEIAELNLMKQTQTLGDLNYDNESRRLALKHEAVQAQIRLHDKTKETVEMVGGLGGKMEETFLGSLLTAEGAAGVMAGAMKEAISLSSVAESAYSKVVEMTGAMVVQADDALASLNKQTGAAGELDAATFAAFDSVKQFGVGMGDAAAVAGTLHQNMSGFAQMGKETQASMIGAAAQLQAVGISGETAGQGLADLMTGLRMSSQEAIATQKDMAQAAINIGMAPAEMAEGFNKAMPTLGAYGKQAPAIFKRVAAAAKGLNVSIDTLLGMTQEMDSFEGAAQAAGKLNSVLGGPLLNSMDLLNASEDERIRMVLQSVEASGKNWASMGKFEKMAIANAAGITDMNEANKMFSKGVAGYDAMQDTMAGNAEEQAKLAEAQAAGVAMSEKLTAIMQEFAMAVMPLVDGIRFLLDGFMLLNTATGGLLIPVLTGLIGVTWLAVQAKKIKAAWTALEIKRTLKNAAVEIYLQGAIALETAAKYKSIVATKMKTMWTNTGTASSIRARVASAAETVQIYGLIAAEKAQAVGTAILTAAKNSSILSSVRNLALTGWELTKTIALTTWTGLLAAGKWALGLASAALGISLGGQATGQAATAATSIPAAAGTTAMGGAAWFAVVPVGLLAIGIGLLAIGIGLMAIAVAAIVWAFVYLIKLFMEAPMAAVQAAGAIALMGVALAVLAVGLAMLTVVAIPAAIALVILGVASLVAAAGMIPLGVGMMFLAGGIALISAASGGDVTLSWLPALAANLAMAAPLLLLAAAFLLPAGILMMIAAPWVTMGLMMMMPAFMLFAQAVAMIGPFIGMLPTLAAGLLLLAVALPIFGLGVLFLGILASLPFFSTGLGVIAEALEIFASAMQSIPTEKAVALGQIFAGLATLTDLEETADGLRSFGWALFPLSWGLSALPDADDFIAMSAGLREFGEVGKQFLLPVGLALAAVAPLLMAAAPMLWFSGLLLGVALPLLGVGLAYLAVGLMLMAPVLPVMAAIGDMAVGMFPFALALMLSGPMLWAAALWFFPAGILLYAAAMLLLPAMFLLGFALPAFAFGLMFLVPLIPFMIILGAALFVLGQGFIALGTGINMLWDKVGGWWSEWYDFTWNLYYGLRRIGWGAQYLQESKGGIQATADLFKVLNSLNAELPHQIHMIALAIEHLAKSMQQLPLTKTIALTATLDAFEGAIHAAIKMKSEAPDGDLGAKGGAAAAGARGASIKSRISSGAGGVADAISSLFGGGGGSSSGGNDVVLVLNNRELGRAIDAHLSKKHNLTIG